MTIQIGRRQIGGDNPIFIIAEIGSNWETLEDCVKSIRIAAEVGADAVKFQAFNFEALYGPVKRPSFWRTAAELPLDWLSTLKAEADNASVEFIVSVFGVDILRAVDPYVNCHKVASSEITNIDLLKEIAALNKPTLISTGAASPVDIEIALAVFRGKPVILNYCIGAYPAKQQDLFGIDALRKYHPMIGLSDHSLDYNYVPRAAHILHRAVAIEKHLTCIGAVTPDTIASLKPDQYKQMVDYLRDRRQYMIGPTVEEIDFLGKHKRRIVAIADIPKGSELLWDNNIGAYRSLESVHDTISPVFKTQVHGRRAAREIKAGQSLKTVDITG